MNRQTAKADSLAQYLDEIHSIALLTVDEERELARRYREQHDTRAAHRLVEANLRFVVKVAFEYRSYGLKIGDLIQEGNLGLMKAVQKFDPDRQIRLISYAVWWIRAYIQNYILRSWSLVKVGTTQAQRKLFFSLARTRHEIEKLSAGDPDATQDAQIDAIAAKLKVRPSDVKEMQGRMEGRDLSLDAPTSTEGVATFLEMTPSEAESQDDEVARAQEAQLVSREVAVALDRLDPRERAIVIARFMTDDPPTLSELGQRFGFSRERARQIAMRAVEKLRAELGGIAHELELPGALRAAAGEAA